MTEIPDDGGPAFPTPHTHDPSRGPFYYSQCMSLRDWFAGQALCGLTAFPSADHKQYEDYDAASRAYRLADAMLAERDKPVSRGTARRDIRDALLARVKEANRPELILDYGLKALLSEVVTYLEVEG